MAEDGKSMNGDEKSDSLDEPESKSDNGDAPAGGDSFSIGETENNDQELAQQIEMRTGALPATSNPANLTSVGDNDDDPPGWPDF
jgi:hypothetical protein